MSVIKHGFAPVYDEHSKLLILGSFPSVKSRISDFYYGNPQNRFWKTICSFLQEEIPEKVDEKRKMLLRHNIALWDIVTECEIEGSKDTTIKNYSIAKLEKILQKSKICFIILNGAKAYDIFCERYDNLDIPFKKLPSTSPANTRFSKEEWFDTLYGVLRRT